MTIARGFPLPLLDRPPNLSQPYDSADPAVDATAKHGTEYNHAANTDSHRKSQSWYSATAREGPARMYRSTRRKNGIRSRYWGPQINMIE